MKKLLYGITILIIIAGSIYFIFSSSSDISKSIDTLSLEKSLVGKYSNATYKFSLKMPEDFVAREARLEESYTILLENKKGEGIQILISPFDDIRELTAEMIHKDLPDLKISDPKVIEIKDGYKGLSFKSNSQSFAGASHEIWFVFKGNLYQISTFEKFSDILRNIFSTWDFK